MFRGLCIAAAALFLSVLLYHAAMDALPWHLAKAVHQGHADR